MTTTDVVAESYGCGHIPRSRSVALMPETRERSDRRHLSPPPQPPDHAGRVVVRRRREVLPRHRLAEAFDAFDTFPALAQSRDRLLALLDAEQPPVAAIVAAIESDIALTIRVMREANRGSARTDSIVKAVESCRPRRSAGSPRTFRPSTSSTARRARSRSGAAARARDRDAARGRPRGTRDALQASRSPHGRRAAARHRQARPRGRLSRLRRRPLARRAHARRAQPRRAARIVVDHALVGGALARRWGLPDALATAIERHHSEDARGDAAFVRLADALAHFAQGDRVAPESLRRMAAAAGLGPTELRAVMCDLPYPDADRPRAIDVCPLTARELEVLEHLAAGKSYNDIASGLDLLTSTVRTHLASIYRKFDAVDRAQAVLIATRRGWL